MESLTNQPLSESPTPLSPTSEENKENHPPPFLAFNIEELIHYFDAKFDSYTQYHEYIHRHLTDWMNDPYFQIFHASYIQHRTLIDQIDSLGKVIKTLGNADSAIKSTINNTIPHLKSRGFQVRIRSTLTQSPSGTQAPSITILPPSDSPSGNSSDSSAISYTSTSPEPKPICPPRRQGIREICTKCRYPTEYDHTLWARGLDEYDGYTCRCPKVAKEALEEGQIADSDIIEPKPTYPNLSTPLCPKCKAYHIRRYCPQFTCQYCWKSAPGHWPNKCPRKTPNKKNWRYQVTHDDEDQNSTYSWDDCQGFYDISRQEDGNLNGEC